LIEEGALDGSSCEPSSYQNDQNKTQPMLLLTDVGFAILVSSFNLTSEAHKKMRKQILSKFAKFQAKATARLLQLEASHKKKERTHGYIVKHGDFIDIQLYERVLRADHSERELAAGEIVYNNWIIQGLVNKNVKLAKAIEEID
jgi:phage regulator Rha-like protein